MKGWWILLLLPSLLSGQIAWDKVTSASIFVYNLEVKDMRHPSIYIFNDGNWANNAIPVEKPLGEEELKQLEKLFRKDLSTLKVGLSKCFIPRHGIVLYDAQHTPIGSVSICFECEAIRVWPDEEVVPPKKWKVKQAENQLAQLKEIVNSTGWPVLDNPKDYIPVINGDK